MSLTSEVHSNPEDILSGPYENVKAGFIYARVLGYVESICLIYPFF